MAKKEKILEYIDDINILNKDGSFKNAKPEEIEAALRRQNIRDKKLEKYFNGKVAVTDAQQKEADRLMKIEEKKMKLNPDYIPKIIDPENIRIAEKPKPIKPDLVNGHSDWTTDDWLEIIDPGGWASPEDEGKRKVQVEENLFEKYLEMLKSGQLLPGTSFKMFEKNYMDYDAETVTKIKKEINKRIAATKRVEGLAALLGASPGRIKP